MMLRPLLALFAFLALAGPVAAQSPDEAETVRATRALSALWRQVDSGDGAALEQACAGALQEIEAIEAALPPVLTQESLARVRALRGLLIVPTDEPGVAYFFPDHTMPWFTSGLGAIAVLSEEEGFIGVRDADGRDIALQLGRVGRQAFLRVRDPDGQIANFVGCAPTSSGA